MAATNPFRVSDLIAKYGWQIMVYLSNLGPTLLAEAQVLFVDSGHTNALDADDTEHGHSFERPLDTIDYAIDLCTAGERSVILVAPGHNEPLAAATIDFDVSDITVIGIGEGSNRPTIDFDNTASKVVIGANNVHLINLRFMPSIDDIVIGVEIEGSITGTILEKCEWAEAEDAGDEFILGLDIKAGCTDTKITNCLFRTEVGADGCTHAIKLTGASDNVIIEKSRFVGNWSTAAIGGDTTLSTDVLIDDCTIKTKDNEAGIKMHTGTTGIIRDACIEATSEAVNTMIVADAMAWFNNYGVTGDGAAAMIIGGGEAVAAVNTAVSNVVAGSLYDILSDGVGGGYAKATDSLEALRTKLDSYSSPTDVTAAVPVSPTSKSLQDILSKADGSNNYDKAEDSLEAISDFVRTGTTLGAGINLDHLMKTVVVDKQVLAEVVDNTVLSHILTKTDGDTSDFDPTTDSLEAIRDAIDAYTDNVSAAVPNSATPRSLQDILNKDDSGSFNDETDSLEAIRDHLDGTTVLGGIQLDHLAKTADGGTNYPTQVTTDSILGMIMSGNGNPSAFNKTTDSLQAIRDHLDGTTALAGIDMDNLIHTSDGDQAYPASLADHSILADIMSSDGTAAGYDRADDSLEAIRDHLDGTTVLGGIQLDTFLGTTTTVSAGDDLENHCVTGSLMAHILGVGADVTTFDCRTDSLEALALALGGFTLDGGAHYDDSVYSNLVLLSKYIVDGDGDFASGRVLPSDTSLVDIIGQFTGPYNATDPDDNIKAALDHLSKYLVDGDGDWANGTALPANHSLYDVLGLYTCDDGADDEDTVMAHLDLIRADVKVSEATGDADIDIDQADYTDYINIMTVTAPATGLANCRIDLDFNKAVTGWDIVSTAGDTLDAVAVVQVDGTNYRSTQKASAQITANGDGSLDASESGKSFDIGPMGPNASIQIHVSLSIERDDVEIPYRVSYVGAAPTITPVEAA